MERTEACSAGKAWSPRADCLPSLEVRDTPVSLGGGHVPAHTDTRWEEQLLKVRPGVARASRPIRKLSSEMPGVGGVV